MTLLVTATIECVECKGNFARFKAEPLERGFGTTLGNALRRVMLAHLSGAATTQVKIDGIQHEFTGIPHLREDATEFLLNAKLIRLKPISGQPGKLILDVEGDGQIHAADIQPSTDFEIINPELYLATMDAPEAKLYVEFDVELGSGYRPAESSNNLPIGVIPIDAIFTPILKVNFTTEPIHVGRETSNERLYLEVWTDGTISPAEALNQSADILTNQLTPFINFGRVAPVVTEEQPLRAAISDEKYNMSVDQLSLSVRTMNCLRRAGITTVGQILEKGEKELRSLRNFGEKSRQEVEERLNELEVSLSPKPEEEPEEEAEEETEDET